MRNTDASTTEDTPRDVVAIGNTYPPLTLLPAHTHRRAQLLYASTGVVTVNTRRGSWVVPPTRAVWIPAGTVHSVRNSGTVLMRSLYIRPAAAAMRALPEECCVIKVSRLLGALLEEAIDLPLLYSPQGRDGRVMELALDEIRTMPVQPLSAPLPQDSRLLQLCTDLLEKPACAGSIDDLAYQISMSRSTFTRLFRRETSMSFGAWLTQVRLLYALRQIASGEPITQVALAAGYASPSAFSAAFRQVLGEAPSRYFRREDQGA